MIKQRLPQRAFTSYFTKFFFFSLFLSPFPGNPFGSVLEAQTCSGTVFRDFNGNGTKDTNEPGILGVMVKAYNAAGTQVGSTATSVVTTGAWSITTGTTATVRVEFQIPTNATAQDYTAESGATYGSSVQFVAGNATGINLGINYPDDYWNNTTQPIPQLMLPCYVNGTVSGVNKDEPAIVRFANDQNGLAITKSVVAKISEVGTVWGNAYQRSKDRFFYSAFLKRHSGFGTRGAGGVYMVEKVTGSYAVAGSFNLQGVVPSNSATALDMGSVTRVTTITGAASNTANNNYIANSSVTKAEPSRDMDAFGKVGKMSFGDIDLDESTNTLYLVNLYQRRLITVDISGQTSALNGASAATLGPLTKAFDIMSLPGLPSCTAGVLRPWGLKIYKGKGYLGVVCDGNDGVNPQDVANLKGYVLSFDLNNIAAGFTTAVSLNLKYPSTVIYRWNTWVNTWAETGLPTTTAGAGVFDLYMQPILSDIEFDETGGMTIAFIDRFGHQTGLVNYVPVSGATTTRSGAALGELLYACYNSTTGTWSMEGSGGCSAANATTAHGGTNYKEGYSGTGTTEHYLDTSGDDNADNGNGAVAQIKGTGLMISVVSDPHPSGTIGATYYNTGGIQWFNTTTGVHSQYAQIFDNSTFLYGKATGLGDIEAALNPAPIEIGNRVWNDTNKNGIQDAGELGIGNVTIELYADFNNDGTPDGAALATTITSMTAGNALGTWYFNTSNVTDGDPSVSGNQTGLAVNKKYLVRIGSADWASGIGVGDLVNYTLTTSNATPTAGLADVSDNDGVLSSTIPTIAYTTGSYGQNDHTLDFGFYACTQPSAITLTKTIPTCAGTTSSNNGKITLTAISNADKYGISTGATYTGVAYASATTIAVPNIVQANIPNTGGTYTIRFFNGGDLCYKDSTVTIYPITCTTCPKSTLYLCGLEKPTDAPYFDHGMITYLTAIGYTVQPAQPVAGGLQDPNTLAILVNGSGVPLTVNDFDKIIVSHSTKNELAANTGSIVTALTNTSKPVLMMTRTGTDVMGMAGSIGFVNSVGDLWIENNATSILPSGLPNGTISVLNDPTLVSVDGFTKSLNYANSVGAGAIVGTYFVDQPSADTRIAYYGYPAGATLANGLAAAGRRFFIGFKIDGASASAYSPEIVVNDPTNFFTAYGKKLLDAAIENTCPCTCDTTLTVTNTTICNGSSVNLFSLASGVKGTLTYSTNGTTWTALTNPTNVNPSLTTTYYVKDTLTGGCFDIDTLVITVNPQPATPTVSSPVMNICPLTTVNLTTISSALTPSVSGGVFEWHVNNSSSSAMVSNQSAVGVGDYYLFEKSPAGCYSTGLKVTTAIQVCCPTPLCIPVMVTRN